METMREVTEDRKGRADLIRCARAVPLSVYSMFASAIACCLLSPPLVAGLAGVAIGVIMVLKHMDTYRD